MKPELTRTYYPEGVNEEILFEGRLMMYTIELPWKNNQITANLNRRKRYNFTLWGMKQLRFSKCLMV
jgi:hypothetical protein